MTQTSSPTRLSRPNEVVHFSLENFINGQHCEDAMRIMTEARREYKRLYQIEYRKNAVNREKAREATRKSRQSTAIRHNVNMSSMKTSYGLSESEFQDLMNTQKGCCKICGLDFSVLSQRASVDHNHETGKVRGLLCSNCNRVVGRVEHMLGLPVTNYLNKPSSTKVFDKRLSRTNIAKSFCELCGSSNNLRIDHNHVTGFVRGVLCNKCNIGLSAVESQTFLKVSQYLGTLI